jgi:cyclic pyranopterin phosphate synthase
MDSLSHTDEAGNVRMVDVSGKAETARRAVAEGFVRLSERHLAALDDLPKGDAIVAATIAGIQAAKKTSELIPLCHNVTISNVSLDIRRMAGGLRIVATAATTAKTGVEMEALTAVSVAALTVYDMVKALGQDIEITGIRLLEKSGGKNDWKRT